MEGRTMKKNLLLFASAFALLLSCGKEAPEAATSPMPDVFYAKVDAATKTGFNYDDVNAKYVHFWNEGDQIYVFHGSARRTYSCTDAANGVFSYVDASEISVTGPFDNYCAVYNSTNGTWPSANGSNTLCGVWQGGFYTSSSQSKGYANVMIANSVDEQLVFKSITGWLKLSLKGWKAVSGFDIVSADYATFINGSYDLEFKADGSVDIVWNEDDNTGNIVNLSSPVTLDLSTPTDFYLALPECTMNGIVITVDYSDGSSETISTANTVTIDRNKVTPMAERFVENFTDLSPASGGASSFVVSAGGYYKFKALTPDVSRGFWDPAPATTSAAVVWESDNSATPVSAGDIITVLGHDGQYVYFKTADSFKEGNALIRTDNHCYHIWCTDAPADIALSGSTTIMDRNLGAVSADPSDGILAQGFYYQLFRPVPFPGNHAASAAITTAEPAGSWNIAKANPTVFYVKSAESDKSWVSKVNALRTIYNYWFPTASSNTKGILDPCPAGYRLMTTPASALTQTPAVGGYVVTGAASSFFPEGSLTLTGNYSGAGTYWFNHFYHASYIYVTYVNDANVYTRDTAGEFSGYQLRCQKE